MRSFWGFYDNGNYRVGCNGSTVYVYDQNNRELGKFKDIKYAYVGAFQPGTNVFVVKSTEGSLAVYDLDRMELLKKMVITRIGAQDEGFAFSPNGEYFFNIEKPFYSTETQLTMYKTTDYEIEKVLFYGDKAKVLDALEFDEVSNECYVLGYIRGGNGTIGHGFVGQLIGGDIVEIKELIQEKYDYFSAYKAWELSGFTAKKLEWSRIKYYAEKPPVSLKQAHSDKKE